MITINPKKVMRNINEKLRLMGIKRPYSIKLPHQVLKSRYKHTFFGYYDKTPFSKSGDKVLAIATNIKNIGLSGGEKAYVGYFDQRKSKELNIIGETTTWCWQMGCRLMWYEDKNDFVIYNAIVNNKHGSVIKSVSGGVTDRELDFPIYDYSMKNKLALSINFSRLGYMRPGYGYVDNITTNDKERIASGDGILLCDTVRNNKQKIMDINTIIKCEKSRSMENAFHYINHLAFSPNGDKFIFYHVWNNEGKRCTRAFICDINGNILNVIGDSNLLSHYAWKNDNEILIYSHYNAQHMCGYILHDINTERKKNIGGRLRKDGHPTIIDGDEFITDTYPSRLLREQRLLIIRNDKKTVIAKIYSPINYLGDTRCDLHPRLSADKARVCIDSPAMNGREMIVINVESIFKKWAANEGI